LLELRGELAATVHLQGAQREEYTFQQGTSRLISCPERAS